MLKLFSQSESGEKWCEVSGMKATCTPVEVFHVLNKSALSSTKAAFGCIFVQTTSTEERKIFLSCLKWIRIAIVKEDNIFVWKIGYLINSKDCESSFQTHFPDDGKLGWKKRIALIINSLTRIPMFIIVKRNCQLTMSSVGTLSTLAMLTLKTKKIRNRELTLTQSLHTKIINSLKGTNVVMYSVS